MDTLQFAAYSGPVNDGKVLGHQQQPKELDPHLKWLMEDVEWLFGWWRQDEEIDIRQTGQVTVTTRRKLVKVMFDGEPMSLRGPLHFRIEPKALRVLAPPPPVVTDREAA